MSGRQARAVHESESCQVTLRIKHPSIDPQVITRELGIEPDHSWACGEQRPSESGALIGGTRRNSYWAAVLPETSPEEFLQSLAKLRAGRSINLRGPVSDPAGDVRPEELAKLTARLATLWKRSPAGLLWVQLLRLRRHQAFLERLQSEGGEASLSIEVETGATLTMEPALGRLMGSMPLQIDFVFA